MELTEIREELDKLDAELVSILSKRMALIPEVANYKKQNNVARYQPEREKQVIETKRKLAEESGINPDLIEKIFKEIINDAHRIEKDIIGE
ncbi:Chorismate mutase [uncultured archaeon]|nr:Chorismate mutase [uncultured archaeon]